MVGNHDDRAVLRGVQTLTDAAREPGSEHRVLATLAASLGTLPHVGTVEVWPPGRAGPDAHVEALLTDPAAIPVLQPGRLLLPVFADGHVAAVLVVAGDTAADGPWVADAGALGSAASAAMTARRAARTVRIDVLTQVLSRTAMDEVLTAELAHGERTGVPVSVVFLDLDRFKAVNDDLGHASGDEVLRAVAGALRTTSRPYDHVARYGGDEFVVVAPGADAAAATELAGRLREAAGVRATAIAGRTLAVSAGVAEHGRGGSAAELLDRADRALRQAKRGGRDRLVLDRPVSRRTTPARTGDGPGADLRRALGGEGLRTAFQPLRDLCTGVVLGYEALSRGPGALERPDHLLAAAGDAGVLVDLDERLRRRSFAAAAAAGLEDPATLFVNCERETLLAMADDDDVWPREPVPFPSVTEVTERALFAHPGRLLRACDRLRELGWGLALDDVGQDPRALALLPLIVPDVVKLDLRLLQDRPPIDVALTTVSVTAHARRTSAVVVAEGIEREDQRDRARALGATVGQGWYFGRPEAALADDDGVAGALPRVAAPEPATGTPFELLADADGRGADRALLAELQAHLERRALGMGALASLTTVLPAAAGDDRAPGRLAHLSRDVGFVALLHPGATASDERGYVAEPLRPEHPLAAEWVTVVTCPHYALALAARPLDPAGERWAYALEHDTDRCLAAARAVLRAHAAA